MDSDESQKSRTVTVHCSSAAIGGGLPKPYHSIVPQKETARSGGRERIRVVRT